MKKNISVLIVDDDAGHRNALKTVLSEWDYGVSEAVDGMDAVSQCGRAEPDIVMLDARMPRMDGFTALGRIRAEHPDLPVIMMTAYSDVPAAVEAMRSGAWDYLTKPLDFDRLRLTLRNAAERLKLGSVNKKENRNAGSLLVGASAPMLELEEMIATIAPSEATVLITGESGTGKELAARAVHNASSRKNGPFVAVNCGTFTESLLASELFGHEKGAFTGADKKHDGLFAQAAGGSIFLDEIGEMPLPMQVRLLRALQEREILPVGGSRPIPVDCRVIAATNRDLAGEVSAGRFREDLYYRLNVVGLHMPPLRERRGDIPLLADHFARKSALGNNRQFSGVSAAAMARLVAWDWPGNVRELENVMERAVILMPGEWIDERLLPPQLRASCDAETAPDPRLPDDRIPTLEEVERKVILETLKRLGNNKTETAKALGITRKTLHAKLNRYLGE